MTHTPVYLNNVSQYTAQPEYAKLPKYAFCKIIKYSTMAFNKAAYELLTEEQKVYFHELIAKTLIINEPLCYYCKELIKDDRKHSLLPPNTIQDVSKIIAINMDQCSNLLRGF